MNYKKKGAEIRKLILTAFLAAQRGHVPSAFSLVEILNVIYYGFVNIDSQNPDDPERDRVFLSKGHGCLALYAILADMGFFSKDKLKNFCQLESSLGGHPGFNKIPGCEMGAGSLGHGPSFAVGAAKAAKIDRKKYRSIVVVGDGECNEGSVWEALLSASKNQLDNFIFVIDCNNFQSYASTKEVLNLEPLSEKLKCFGFDTYEVDMYEPESFENILNFQLDYENKKPKAFICKTVKGAGASFMENDLSWHHKSKLSGAEQKMIEDLIEEL